MTVIPNGNNSIQWVRCHSHAYYIMIQTGTLLILIDCNGNAVIQNTLSYINITSSFHKYTLKLRFINVNYFTNLLLTRLVQIMREEFYAV